MKLLIQLTRWRVGECVLEMLWKRKVNGVERRPGRITIPCRDKEKHFTALIRRFPNCSMRPPSLKKKQYTKRMPNQNLEDGEGA
jgi:hypothetical protein